MVIKISASLKTEVTKHIRRILYIESDRSNNIQHLLF